MKHQSLPTLGEGYLSEVKHEDLRVGVDEI